MADDDYLRENKSGFLHQFNKPPDADSSNVELDFIRGATEELADELNSFEELQNLGLIPRVVVGELKDTLYIISAGQEKKQEKKLESDNNGHSPNKSQRR